MNGHSSLNIVVPMAGEGARFRQAGWSIPKPMIPVLGRPMYSWALDSLPLELGRLILVAQRDHLAAGLGDDVRHRYAEFDPAVVAIDGPTDGQLCTVLAARALLDEDAGVLIYNADTRCEIDPCKTTSDSDGIDGTIGVFEAPGDHWSFARIDAEGWVVETAEKRRISPLATTGLYHFSSTRSFCTEAERMIVEDDRTKGEFYVAPLYDRMIRLGYRFRVSYAATVEALGTPAELAAFVHARGAAAPIPR